MAEVRRGHLHWGDLATPAGALTLARLPIAVIFPFVVHDVPLALGLYGLALLSDFLDGYVARRMNQVTHTGAVADGWLDKVLHVNAAWAMVLAGYMPGWWMILWFTREIILWQLIPFMTGPYWRGEVAEQHASAVGKIASWTLGGALVTTLLGMVEIAWFLSVATGVLGLVAAVGYLRRLVVQKRALASA